MNRRKERGSGFTLPLPEGAIAKENAALPAKKELKNVRKKSQRNTRPYPTRSQKKSRQRQAWKSASPYRPHAAKTAARVRMTVSFPQDSNPERQHSFSLLDKQYGYIGGGWCTGRCRRKCRWASHGKLKTVDPNAQEVLQAKRMGISFGD